MELKLAFYAIVIFSTILIAAGVVVTEWADDYNSGTTYDLENLDELDAISGSATEQKDRINPTSSDPSTDYEASLFKGVYGIITDIFRPLKVVFGDGGMLDSVGERFGIPNYVKQMFMALMFFAFIFSIIAIVFRLGRSSA